MLPRRSLRSTGWRVHFWQAFEKWPRLVRPLQPAAHGPRVFELRIYEGATDQDHRRKVEMMQSGESEIFTKAGVEQVFYSETLIGSRLPNLTYMLAFDNLADRDKKWAAFRASDEWKTYSTQPKYAFEAIVSTINNFILTADRLLSDLGARNLTPPPGHGRRTVCTGCAFLVALFGT